MYYRPPITCFILIFSHFCLFGQTCKVPFSLSFSDRTSTSVKLKWFDTNVNPLGWEVEIVKRGQPRTGKPNLPFSNKTDITIDGLEPGTSYELYIRTVCTSNAASAWNVAIPFITVLDMPTKCSSNITLKDNGTEVLLLDVKQKGTLGVDVFLESVELILEHDWPADVQLTLETPGGQQVILTNHNGINADDFGDITDTTCRRVTLFSPNACSALKDSKPPYIGAFKMDGDITNWRIEDVSKGYWKLICYDRALKDVGTLKYINLNFNTIQCQIPENFNLIKADVNALTVSWKPFSLCNTVKINLYQQGKLVNTYFTECQAGRFVLNNLTPNEQFEITIASVCSFGSSSQESCAVSASTTCEPVILAEGFDDKQICLSGCDSPCPLIGSIWYNPVEDGAQDWIVHRGKTDTPNTGPSDDINGSGNYIYIENNPILCTSGHDVVLQSECIHVLSNVSGCDMSFYHHMYGEDIKSLRLEISIDNGETWQTLYSKNGNQGDKWQRVTLSLKKYHDMIALFRFVAPSGSGTLNDIALDQIEFYKSVIASDISTYYFDQDGDGYGLESQNIHICSNIIPDGYALKYGDCDDNNNKIYPGAIEIQCNGIDENCNGNDDDKASTNPINISFQVNKTSCNGSGDGSIYLVVSGGNEPYDITWNNSKKGAVLENISAGIYSAIIKDIGGCIAKSDFIEVSPKVYLNAIVTSKKDASCLGKNDGSIIIEHTTGNAPYKYQWSNNQTTKNLLNIPKGSYSLTVTDSRNCQATLENIAIDATPFVLTDITEVSHPFCMGQNTGMIALQTVKGIPPFRYEWNTGSSSEKISGLKNGTYICTVTDSSGCQNILTIPIKSPDTLSGKVISTENVRCFGENNGSIKTDIKGGKPPYSYFWSNFGTTDDIFGLRAGPYTLGVTDANGCKLVLPTIQIVQPPPFELRIDSLSPSTCILGKDGFIKINPSGGNGGYKYAWSHSEISDSIMSNITSGNYNVTSYDKLGCKASIPNIFLPYVNDEVKIQIDLHKENVCYKEKNAIIIVRTENDKPPIDYNWSFGSQYFSQNKIDTIRSLPASIYTVTVTDHQGCTGISNTIVIEEKPIFYYTVTSISNNICNNDSSGSIKISISGGTPPYGVLWNGGLFSGLEISKLANNKYTGIISDAKGCQLEILPIIIESYGNLKLNSKIIHSSNNNQNGSICLSPTGGIPPYQFKWSSSNSKDSCLLNLKAGDYQVTITDNSGCSSVHGFKIENTSSTQESVKPVIQIFPNPATNTLTIISGDKIQLLRLYSVDGLLMLQDKNLKYKSTTYEVSNLNPGIYFLQIQIGSAFYTKPLMIIR